MARRRVAAWLLLAAIALLGCLLFAPAAFAHEPVEAPEAPVEGGAGELPPLDGLRRAGPAPVEG